LMPVSALRDRALAIAVELQHSAYNCFYLALAERAPFPYVAAFASALQGLHRSRR